MISHETLVKATIAGAITATALLVPSLMDVNPDAEMLEPSVQPIVLVQHQPLPEPAPVPGFVPDYALMEYRAVGLPATKAEELEQMQRLRQMIRGVEDDEGSQSCGK